MSTAAHFDHIAFGVSEIAAATPFLVGALGGAPLTGGPGGGFRAFQWRFRGGGVIEVLEPAGPAGGFMHRFLEQRGPGIHHVTFKVPDLDAACARAEAAGYAIVGYDASDPAWMEAFLHPRQAQGIVVQLAQSDPQAGGEWGSQAAPLAPAPSSAPSEVVGLRLRAASEERARRQWGQVAAGSERRCGELLEFAWPGSPMRIAVAVDDAGPEGPLGVEVRGAPAGALPDGVHPVLGGRFLAVP
ncbi:MAG TPA: VOC family protein [Thermoanaerobaculia bacterium]|nr:VOC family protein [Thermoanaerobaculia bacterium]